VLGLLDSRTLCKSVVKSVTAVNGFAGGFRRSKSLSLTQFAATVAELLSSRLMLRSPGVSTTSCRWVRACFCRLSERLNRRPQTEHSNRFSPVWVRTWRCSSSDRLNRLPQYSQLQTNGRSPVCHLHPCTPMVTGHFGVSGKHANSCHQRNLFISLNNNNKA